MYTTGALLYAVVFCLFIGYITAAVERNIAMQRLLRENIELRIALQKANRRVL